jgi:uncharacterized membrane protein
MYRWILAAHVAADFAFVGGLMATWLLNGFRAGAREPGFEAVARGMAEWGFEVWTNTAMWVVLATGVTLVSMNPLVLREPWMWLKIALLAGLFGMHGLGARARRELEADPHRRPARYFERMALGTAAIAAGIIGAVIVK